MYSASATQGAIASLPRANQHRTLLQRRSKAARARRRTEYAIGAMMAGLVVAAMAAAWVYYAELALTPATAPDPNAFTQTRLGRIVVPADGTGCREFSFDNETGRFGSDRQVRCDDGKVAASTPGLSASFESYKRAFGKK